MLNFFSPFIFDNYENVCHTLAAVLNASEYSAQYKLHSHFESGGDFNFWGIIVQSFSNIHKFLINYFFSIYNSTVGVANFSIPEYNITLLSIVVVFVIGVFTWCFYQIFNIYKDTIINIAMSVITKHNALVAVNYIQKFFFYEFCSDNSNVSSWSFYSLYTPHSPRNGCCCQWFFW